MMGPPGNPGTPGQTGPKGTRKTDGHKIGYSIGKYGGISTRVASCKMNKSYMPNN